MGFFCDVAVWLALTWCLWWEKLFGLVLRLISVCGSLLVNLPSDDFGRLYLIVTRGVGALLVGFCDFAVWLALTWWLSLGFMLTVFPVVLCFIQIIKLGRDIAEVSGMWVLLLFGGSVRSESIAKRSESALKGGETVQQGADLAEW